MLTITLSAQSIGPREVDCVIRTPSSPGQLLKSLPPIIKRYGSLINAISTPEGTTEIPDELLCKLEAKVDYFEEKAKETFKS